MTKNKFSTLVHPIFTQLQNLFLAVENEINTMSLNLNHYQRYVHLVYQNSYNYLYSFQYHALSEILSKQFFENHANGRSRISVVDNKKVAFCCFSCN